MNFSEALIQLREGKKVRRKDWPPNQWIKLFDSRFFLDEEIEKWEFFNVKNILAEDWEIVDDIR